MGSRTDADIDQIIAMCEGDLRGALKALMLVNEHLEGQLEQLQAAAGVMLRRQSGQSLH